MLTDENAFGVLFAFHDIEDVEYTLEPEEFVARFSEFRSALLGAAADTPLGAGTKVLDLGHALYFEIGDGDQAREPIGWLKAVREALTARGFATSAVLTHGGRWVTTEVTELPAAEALTEGYVVLSASRPSEPLRRALYAEAASHGADGESGWGSGVYVDAEAIEALGKSLKNAPTTLSAAGATFYRIAR